MYSKIVNRVLDLVVAIPLLILFFPLMCLISFLIWIEDRGSIFADNSLRLGKDRKPFFMYKFRSMILDAHNLIKTNEKYSSIREEWILKDKLSVKNDPRITMIGKIIRTFDFDELAQLINVIKGEMSIVGPRPWFLDELDRNIAIYPQSKKYLNDIFSVKPGITGRWQIKGRNRNTILRRFELDYEYVKMKSFWYDLWIMLVTPFSIIDKIIWGELDEKQKR
jgi:lipopolysaccharide/colanic/teichoic acid biosynthesis glycosyltransferase